MSQSNTKVRGFVRGALHDTDTGETRMGEWHENVITQLGFQNYLCYNLIASAGSLTPSHIAIGSATAAHASTDTVATGQYSPRGAVTASVVASKTARFVASWAANTDATGQIANCALHAHSATNTGSAMCLSTYTASTKSCTQTFSISYDISFA
jgi:hypothetical protein